MSDLYDSLEDESDEKNSSSDSLEECKADESDSARGGNRSKPDSFPFNENLTAHHPNSSESFQCKTTLHNRNFLPEIENATKDWDGTPNLIVDSQILRKQGLQINDDGSFTKSPRPHADELPFITREYRNLQFQKKKTYQLGKRTCRVMISKKNIFSFTKNPDDGIRMNKTISERREKGSSEEILTSAGSLSCHQGKPPNRALTKDNLTDSMKEKLLQDSGNTPCETLKVMSRLKKTKRVMNLLEARKVTQKNRCFYPATKSLWNSIADHNDCQTGNRKKPRTLGSEKLQPDVGTKGPRACLNYSERRQLQSGFNPVHLRMGSKKVLSVTSRSNFGDSVAERLSEVSSRVLSSENLRDEDEEEFYRSLMEKDKGQKQVQRSSRSEGTCEFPKLKSFIGPDSSNQRKELRQNNLKFKPISKSMSIDLPSESENANRSIRKYHYCTADSSSKLSKLELALKAKTYGYMANARNIFKMKAQFEGKCWTPKEEDGNYKVCATDSGSVKKASGRSRQIESFSSKSALPEMPEKVRGASERASNVKKPGRKTTTASEDSVRGVSLPRVAGTRSTDTKLQAEILHRMSSCLNSPCGQIEGVASWTFK